MFVEEKREGELKPASPLRDIYESAITILETHGWIQEGFGSNYLGYCIVGAIARAANLPNDEAEAIWQLMNPIREIIKTSSVVGWNDYHKTKYEDVIRVLKTAAERS